MDKSTRDEFLEWVSEQDGGYVRLDVIEEAWPEFPQEALAGATLAWDPENEVTRVPKRDLRSVARYGVPWD